MDPHVIHRRRWATLSVLCVSLLIIGLDNTVLNVALPTLERDLHATAGQLQWIVDAYTLAFAGLLLLAGAWGDKYGRRFGLIVGLVLFGASSVWAALAGSPTELIMARAAMGVGGALIMPSTLSILTNSFTDQRERKTAIGIWSGVSGIGVAIGPALGGFLVQHYHWSSVFYVNVPVVVVGLIGALLIVPESKDPAAPRLDLVGGALSVVGLVALVWAIIEAPRAGWGAPKVIAGFVVGAVLLLAFTIAELRVRHPMLDVRLFANRRFSVPAVSVALVFFVLFGTALFLSMYLQTVLGYNALQAGIRILPIAVGLVIGAPLSMAIAQRVGEKIPTAVGMGLLAAAYVVIAGVSVDSGYARVFVATIILGFGLSFAMSPATEAVMGALPKEKAGVGSAVNDTVRQVGGALGVAVLGSIINSVYTHRMADHLLGLPGPAAAAAKDNVVGAAAVAARLPAPYGAKLTESAYSAFVHALNVTGWIAAALCVVGAVAVIVLLPHHAAPPAGTGEREPDLVGAGR